MPKLLKTILFISLFLILFSTILSAEESITIVTYYPSPYGVYRELRSQRMAVGETYINHDTVCWEGDFNCVRYALTGQTVIPTGSFDPNVDLIVEGNVGIGTTGPDAQLQVDCPYNSDLVKLMHIRGISNPKFIFDDLYADANTNPHIILRKARAGGGVGLWNPGVIASGDYLGSLEGWGYDGSNYILGASIEFQSEGNISTGVVPAGISFSAGNLGTPGSNQLYKRMKIAANGNVGIGTTAPEAKLDVNGGIKVGSDSTCNTNKTGTMRYNSGIEYCDGSSWKPVGAKTWQTDWFSAGQGNTKVFNHPLGSKYLMTAILWSPNSNYTPIYNISYFIMGAYGYGAQITSITDTQLTVQIGNRWITFLTSSGGPSPDTAGGYYKVLATRID